MLKSWRKGRSTNLKKKSKKIQKKSPKKSTKRKTRSSATSASTLIDLHYGRINLVKRWNRERIERLLGFLRLSQAELASLVAVPHNTFGTQVTRGKFSPPVCLLLTILEGRFLRGIAPDVITNVFDFYGRSESTGRKRHDAKEAS
jgi:hypothetical protein